MTSSWAASARARLPRSRTSYSSAEHGAAPPGQASGATTCRKDDWKSGPASQMCIQGGFLCGHLVPLRVAQLQTSGRRDSRFPPRSSISQAGAVAAWPSFNRTGARNGRAPLRQVRRRRPRSVTSSHAFSSGRSFSHMLKS